MKLKLICTKAGKHYNTYIEEYIREDLTLYKVGKNIYIKKGKYSQAELDDDGEYHDGFKLCSTIYWNKILKIATIDEIANTLIINGIDRLINYEYDFGSLDPENMVYFYKNYKNCLLAA